MCVFAANFIWQARTMVDEKLIIVLRLPPDQQVTDALRAEINTRNQRLLPFKRVSGYLNWPSEFPRTAKFEIARRALRPN